MSIDINSLGSIFVPRFGQCNDVLITDEKARKIIWLVPHVIKHKQDSEVITWRCNWGNVCKSQCIYARVKEKAGRIETNYGIHIEKNPEFAFD
jgi:hypothetical protein